MKQLSEHITIQNDYLLWECEHWKVEFVQRIVVTDIIEFKTDIISSNAGQNINEWFGLAKDEITTINKNLICSMQGNIHD